VIAHAYDYCEQLTKQHATSFYEAFRVLDARRSRAVWAVYAFCRTVDDLVDVVPESLSCADVHARVDAFAHAFERMLAGTPDPDPLWIALADTFATYTFSRVPFDDLIVGQRQDIDWMPFATVEDLETYCYRVAGTVGLMLLPILAPDHTAHMHTPTIRLGIAMQWTNIIRDIREDAARGRTYIPQDVMDAHGYAVSDIAHGVAAPAWQAVFAHMTAIAQAHYVASWDALEHYPPHSQRAVKTAAMFYAEILHECIRRGGDVFSARVYVPAETKQRIARTLCAP
jgi:phytoene synthase